jgi:CBS domain-containing protein
MGNVMPTRTIRSVISERKLHVVTSDATVLAAAQHMVAHHVAALPVLDKGVLVGMFTERDALSRVLVKGLDPANTPVAKVMSAHPVTVGADKTLLHALIMMADNGFRHMPFVDNGELVGVVSVRDALGPEMSELTRSLEQRDQLVENLR